MLSNLWPKTTAPMDPGKPIVRCEDDYERATQRIAELSSVVPGSPQEAELIALVEAVEKWDARHDDATGWE